MGYARVSTEEQAQSGVSLEDQEHKIRLYGEFQELDLLGVAVDAGVSAKDLNRDGIQSVLKQIRGKKIDVLVVTKLDRLTRNVRDLLDLIDLTEKYDVALVSLHETLDTKTAVGRMVIKIIASVAEMEREQVGERTRAAIQHKKSKGEKTGGKVPYGFDVIEQGARPDGTPIKVLVPNEQEQVLLQWMREAKESGKSFAQIADELNAAGHKTKEGSTWRRQYIHRILGEK